MGQSTFTVPHTLEKGYINLAIKDIAPLCRVLLGVFSIISIKILNPWLPFKLAGMEALVTKKSLLLSYRETNIWAAMVYNQPSNALQITEFGMRLF